MDTAVAYMGCAQAQKGLEKLAFGHAIAALLVAGITTSANAQNTIPQEYDKTIKATN